MGFVDCHSNSSRKTMSLGRKLASRVRGGDCRFSRRSSAAGKTCFRSAVSAPELKFCRRRLGAQSDVHLDQ